MKLKNNFANFIQGLKTSRTKRLKFILISVGIILYLLLLTLFRLLDITRESIDMVVGPLEKYGLPVLFLMQVVFSLTPFPDNFLIYGGVIVFGPVETFIAIYLSYLIATSVHFWIARHYGKNWVFNRFPKIKDGMEKHAHLFNARNLVLYRFIAFNTFDILAYAAGFSNISYASYLFSSIISMPLLILPSVLFFQGLFAESLLRLILTYAFIGALYLGIFGLMKLANTKINGNKKAVPLP